MPSTARRLFAVPPLQAASGEANRLPLLRCLLCKPQKKKRQLEDLRKAQGVGTDGEGGGGGPDPMEALEAAAGGGGE